MIKHITLFMEKASSTETPVAAHIIAQPQE